MNPEQSHKLVKQTFQADFDRQRFVEFIDKLLKRVDFSKQFMQSGLNIRRAFIDKVNSFERVGQYTDSDGKKIDILIVNLKRDITLERGRTGLRNFAADYLQSDRGAGKSAVLIAYVSSTQTDWRFSYVTLEKDLRQNEKGRFTEEVTKLTPARRYSFLVGKNENSHTAQRQFFELLGNSAPKLQNIEDAFNIEKVTKEFFAEYKLLFEKVRSELDRLCKEDVAVRDEFIGKGLFAYAKDADDEELLDQKGNRIKEPYTDDFAKKLLGQIVFLYFLQKKGWFGVKRDEQWGTGDKSFLRTLFSANTASTNFFDAVLEPLFYNALAVKREHDWSDRFNCKIPFLNGGLFEPLNGYDWVHTELNLPNTLFSNNEISIQGDKGTGILDVFDRYNFTINEAEPLEVEVAVDPEMLGKIFENLLPENIRHGSGTYYTPRVIVAYMCQQSLINYLASHLPDISRDDIENFIRFGSQQRDYTEAGTQSQAKNFLPQSVVNNARGIDKYLSTITVCDPAIGSGAFPVGMMLEIVNAREALQSVEGIKPQSQYDLKRQTIENSLYGVDIDSGAVEIAKLRLWLSLIVDEADFQKIEPLPNLDYKIMQGNSLFDAFHGVKLVDESLFTQKTLDKKARIQEIDAEIAQLTKDLGVANVGRQSKLYELTKNGIAELLKRRKMVIDGQVDFLQSHLFAPVDELHQKLEDLKRKHKQIFDETRKDVKEKLRNDAEKLEWEFIEAKLRTDGNIAELSELEIQRNDRRRNYFLWQLNFPEIFQAGGFDIVIGNPPYVRIQELEQSSVEQLKAKFVSATGKFDIYVTFIEQGFSLLRNGGTLAFINPNKFFNSSYGVGLRRKLSGSRNVWKIVDFGNSQVFESATTYTCLLFLSQSQNSQLEYKAVKTKEDIRLLGQDALDFAHHTLPSDGKPWIFSDRSESAIFDKMVSHPPLISLCDEIFQGLISGGDKLFFLELVSEDTSHINARSVIDKNTYTLEKEICFRLLKGSEIRRYSEPQNAYICIFPYETDSSGKTVLISEPKLQESYPRIFEYLLKFRSELSKRGSERMEYESWYAMWCPRKLEKFTADKIITQVLSATANYTIDRTHKTLFVGGGNAGGYGIIPKNPSNLFYLLGVLNSRLMDFYLRKHSTQFRGGFYSYARRFIQNCPIPEPSAKTKVEIEKLVNEILNENKSGNKVVLEKLERELDRAIYGLFGLNEIEISDVERTFN